VPETTDRALRTYLAHKGSMKGDISRFVDEVVQSRLFDLTVENGKTRNRALAQQEILTAIEEAVGLR
jgi:hypothetical protein